MNELQIFNDENFGDVRVRVIDGKEYFSATDVAKALGYSNPRKAILDHCKRVTNRYVGVKTGVKSDGSDAMQKVAMNFITEGGEMHE